MKRTVKDKRVIILLAAVALLAIGGALFVKNNRDERAQVEKTAQENHARNDTPAASTNSTSATSAAAKPSNPSTTVPTPVLIKSSGNNGPVPAGANIEFVCQAKPGYSCTVILTNRSNPSNVINLGAKTISGSQADTTGASWIWEAVKGSWSVKAVLSDSSGNSTSSASQNLEVN